MSLSVCDICTYLFLFSSHPFFSNLLFSSYSSFRLEPFSLSVYLTYFLFVVCQSFHFVTFVLICFFFHLILFFKFVVFILFFIYIRTFFSLCLSNFLSFSCLSVLSLCVWLHLVSLLFVNVYLFVKFNKEEEGTWVSTILFCFASF